MTNHHWCYNISAALINLRISYKIGTDKHTKLVLDGYYNICELNEEVFQPLGAELQLPAPTGGLMLSVTEKPLILNKWLAEILGFTETAFNVKRTYIADKPYRLTFCTTVAPLHCLDPSLARTKCLVAVGLKYSLSCNTKAGIRCYSTTDSHRIKHKW